MASLFKLPSRRSLLKLFFALPLAKALENCLALLFGKKAGVAMAAAPLKVAKLSQLNQPWSSVPFTYRVKIKTKDVYKKDVVSEESIPGLVIRLPDEAAGQTEGAKGKLYVVDLHCTHERCVTAYLTNKEEIRAVSDVEAKNPVAFCPCHRSVFDLAQQGKAVKGPAKNPLWKFDFTVKGEDVLVTGLEPKASIWAPGRPGGLTSEYPVRQGEEGL